MALGWVTDIVGLPSVLVPVTNELGRTVLYHLDNGPVRLSS